ncbi:MAG: NLP/P60 hydrolase [Marivivens sp.]|nr:NLP/P60 hydrolase [Marivivens sp.]
MSDRRTTAVNERVAASHLLDTVQAPAFVDGETSYVQRPVVDLLDIPGGKRDRQLLAGAKVTVYEDLHGWSFIQSALDGYVGYVLSSALNQIWRPTHRIVTRSTHAYRDANMKSADLHRLSLGAEVPVESIDGEFADTPLGYIPSSHLRPCSEFETDTIAIAARLLGTPYLWGGNSADGIDCSGLVQMAHRLCGLPCPADSDQQQAAMGMSVDDAPQKGDLFFWPGHVALVADPQRIIHANAHHMAVSYEPIKDALERIGPVTAHKRL